VARALASLSATMVAASGCYEAPEHAHEPGEDQALAALMADGPLPAGMQPAPMPPPAPPRFCDGQEPDPGDDDAGVDDPGFPIPGPFPGGPGPGIPVSPPSMGTAGVGAAGSSPPDDDPPPMGGSDGGVGSDLEFCEDDPIGFWRFDDCNPQRTDLRDSSDNGHLAFRNVDLTCPAGQEGLAVSFARQGDLVYSPDQPAYALDHGVTVAAWVRPNRVDKVQTLFRKRDDNTSSIALVINSRKFQFVLRLASGRLVSVSTPARANQWTHVAATYDGSYLRLYTGGELAAEVAANGTIARGVGPLLMGNDIKERRLLGMMDNAWFNTVAASADTIRTLTCIRKLPTLSIEPQSVTVEPGTNVPYTLTVTNTNDEVCEPEQFFAFAQAPAELSVFPFIAFVPPIASGESADVPFDVTSSDETEPGTYTVVFRAVTQGNFFPFPFPTDQAASVEAEYIVAEPTGCHVRSGRALTIRDVSVVDDPLRTSLDGPAGDPRTGAWSFGRMMERLSPSDAAAPAVTEAMFRSFTSPQVVNGFTIEPRELMEPIVLGPWPRTDSGELDLARAPLRLLAIVNRLDLKDLAQGKAGEGRMVYGVLDGDFSLEFTVILEYALPATTEEEFTRWAHAWHALQALPFPSEEYNAALQALTDAFTGRDAVPSNPNGSALIDIRTNEIALSFQWELREFHISPETGFMEPAPVFQTPDQRFNFTDTLGRFINENEAVILTERHEVPLLFEGEPFQGGAVFNNIDIWEAPNVTNPEARHKFSLNTCNGCHGGETNTSFLQISPREPGQQSFLAGFQTGTTVFDPFTGESRRLAELARRRALMESVVCPPEP
jgi:hypothetical protein